MGMTWVWTLAGFFLMEATSVALAVITLLLRLVAVSPGLLGVALTALLGMALLTLTGWLWLDRQLMSLASVWLPELGLGGIQTELGMHAAAAPLHPHGATSLPYAFARQAPKIFDTTPPRTTCLLRGLQQGGEHRSQTGDVAGRVEYRPGVLTS